MYQVVMGKACGLFCKGSIADDLWMAFAQSQLLRSAHPWALRIHSLAATAALREMLLSPVIPLASKPDCQICTSTLLPEPEETSNLPSSRAGASTWHCRKVTETLEKCPLWPRHLINSWNLPQIKTVTVYNMAPKPITELEDYACKPVLQHRYL